MSIGTNRDSYGGIPIAWEKSLDAPFIERWGDEGEDDEVEDIVFSRLREQGATKILACWTKPPGWKKPDAGKSDPFNWQLRARAG